MKGRTSWLVLLVLFALRIPFLLIHHVQEDAYITFRTARHLAEQHDFSFNLHQHFPATTSLLYPFLVAGIDLISHTYMVLGVQWMGTLFVVLACWLAARALSADHWPLVWLLLGSWPISLVVSYTGMETSLLLLVLGMAIYAFARPGRVTLFAASMLLLPLVRPDAVAYGIVFCAAMLVVDRRAAVAGWVALAAGGAILLIGNRITIGAFVPTTVRAKEMAYHPSHAPAAILGRIHEVCLHQSFLLPVSTSYLTRVAPILLVLVAFAFVFAFFQASGRRERMLVAALAVLAAGVPAAYAAGGVLFDWYLFPANWLAMAAVLPVLVRALDAGWWHRPAWVVVAILWVGLAALQWTRSLAQSTQDFHYRGDIGRYLGQLSHGQGTLFLEPAGYIPYYSGLKTDDEVGLVSGRISGYMLRDANLPEGEWWIDYVETEKPDYIVQRESFARFETFQGYTLTPEQQQWFNEHYVLLRRTHYEPWVYHPSRIFQKIFALGPMPDYLVYERRDWITRSSPAPTSQSR